MTGKQKTTRRFVRVSFEREGESRSSSSSAESFNIVGGWEGSASERETIEECAKNVCDAEEAAEGKDDERAVEGREEREQE